MLVTGGRFGWARVVWLGVLSWGVVGLLATAACGSRTSMLDPDAYGQSEGGSSSRNPLGNAGKASPGTGGRPIVATGGATTSPTAGTSNTGASSGVDPSLAIAPCQQYCPGYGTQCKKRLKGQECLPTCQGELNNSGPFCQALGTQALNCLAPFFSRGGGDCDAAVNRALTQCGVAVTQFEECKKRFASGTPSANFVTSCPRSGDPGGDTCTQIFSCNNGPYVTFCNPSGQSPARVDCTCITPTGQTLTARIKAEGDACLDAAALCQ